MADGRRDVVQRFSQRLSFWPSCASRALALFTFVNREQAQQEHDDAKEVFEYMNEQLITELPQLIDLRVPYFDPTFEAMSRMQCKFAQEGYEKLGGVQRSVALCLPLGEAVARIC